MDSTFDEMASHERATPSSHNVAIASFNNYLLERFPPNSLALDLLSSLYSRDEAVDLNTLNASFIERDIHITKKQLCDELSLLIDDNYIENHDSDSYLLSRRGELAFRIVERLFVQADYDRAALSHLCP